MKLRLKFRYQWGASILAALLEFGSYVELLWGNVHVWQKGLRLTRCLQLRLVVSIACDAASGWWRECGKSVFYICMVLFSAL